MVARISTQMMYDRGVSQLSTLQSNLLKTQLQLSTGRRVLTPADDPVASARALEVGQSQQLNEQYSINRQTASSTLAQADTVLDTLNDIMDDVRGTVLQAGSPTLSQSDRDSLAADLEASLQDILGQANTADGTGGYLFSGYKTNTQPFALTSTGANYYGDQGQRELQVGSGRQMAISASGSEIFEQNLTGNGTFLTQADAGNAARGGTGVISPGTVVNAKEWVPGTYSITFSKTAEGVTQYAVTDADGAEVVPATDFKSGEPIQFRGISFDIAGVPAADDQFTVEPSKNQSVFQTIRDVITALRTAGSGPAVNADLTNKLNTANQNLQNAQDNMVAVRASIGARGRELDYLDSSGSALNIEYESQINDLINVDEIEAASRFVQQTTSLQAAQQTFKTATGLSLFNYI
ncbi:flagellar hook-associated protein 3 FlgL [Pseudoduganella lurida]|uniref:Flagellar hook-associated protein 3 FlgL n=1 Tax=Pseudoduganella lurida TaxID=1036180 RepID=A0A562R7Q3_9BURK|nr:flagellar hook-associated protein FlgL [Pseudoduganella lurida]TWI64584.1 flagellar hook-associated protein 3 FlgL [Pseudoduganella lurida]